MAWFEFHQSLVPHRKLYTLAGKLRVSRPTAAGHLAFLWSWSLDNAPDGDLTNVDPHVLKLAADWPKKAGDFIQACIESGFIDEAHERRTIHDWDVYAGRLVGQRAANAERMKAARAAQRAKHVQGLRAKHVQGLPTDSTNSTVPTTPAAAGAREQPPDAQRAITAWERQSPGSINPTILDALDGWLLDGIPIAWIESACEDAGQQGGRKGVRYIGTILTRYRSQNGPGRNGAAAEDDAAKLAREFDKAAKGKCT